MNAVAQLEDRFLLTLEQIAVRVRAAFPNVSAYVWSSPTGSATNYQGHGLGVDCLLRDADASDPDNIALCVSVRHLTTTPEMDAADVCWGHPSGYLEADFVPTPEPFTVDVLERVATALPDLEAALFAALLRRGTPPHRWP